MITAREVLAGAHRSYAPAILGAVTAVHPYTHQGGLSLVTAAGEQRALLSAKDLQVLHIELGKVLAAYQPTNSQSSSVSDGSKSALFSPDEVLK